MIINFSVVIPVYNESQNIKNLIDEIILNLKNYQNYEIVVVNDFSDDGTTQVLENINKNKNLNIICNSKRLGQSFSIIDGIKNSKFENIVTIDGDGQNNPKDILKLLDQYFSNDQCYLVSGIRLNRKDTQIKIISSKIANYFRAFILNDDCADTGCSLKIFKKDIFLKFPQFDGLHRFLPAFFKAYGSNNIYLPVDHRPRISGISKYGVLERLFKGIFDIVRVKKLLKKNTKQRYFK